MRFSCPKCASKYTIADERVLGKVLKIRCKSCNTIIKIRKPKSKFEKNPDKELETASSVLEKKSQDSSKQEKKDPSKPKDKPGLYEAVKRSAEVLEKRVTGGVEWFVGIDNAPFGPVSVTKIHSLKKSGKIDDQNLVWKEGMGDWAPAGQCKELVGLLAKLDLELDLTEKKEEKKEDKEETKEDKKSEELLHEKPPTEDVEKPEKKAPQISAEESFFKESGDFKLDENSKVQTITSLTPPRPASQGQNRWVLIAAIGFFAVAVATFGVALLGSDKSNENTTSVETGVRVIERVVYRDRPVESVEEDSVEVVDESEEEEDISKPRSKTNRNKSKKKREDEAKTKALMEQLGHTTPGGVVPVGGDSPKNQSTSSSSGNGSLTASQVKKVVDKNKNKLKACYERALRKGDAPDDSSIRVDFKLNVGSSGVVKNTKLSGEGAKIESLNVCLSRSVSKWVFPASSSSSPVEFPFVFTPK